MEGDQEPGDTMRWFSDTGEKKRRGREEEGEREEERRGKSKERGEDRWNERGKRLRESEGSKREG